MQTKTLFSRYYLEHRLPEYPEWAEVPQPTFETLRALWDRAQQFGETWSEAQTEDEFIKPALEALGWTYIVQPKSRQAGRVTRPDYALFADAEAKEAAYPHQGDDAAFYGRALAIAEAKFWGRPLSQKDSSGRDTWKTGENPSHQMVSYLVGARAPWGLLTNGRVWRLYSREVSSTASEFYEVDLAEIFEPEAWQTANSKWQEVDTGADSAFPIPNSKFKLFWLFFRRDAFSPDAQGRCFVQRVHEGSATYAREISDKLKELVYAEVMPEIAGGFLAYRREQLGITEESEADLRAVYRASLSLLYKLLFLLYAEARGLLPVENSGYREQSLTALAQWAAERRDRALPLSTATHAAPKYQGLLALFRRIDQGDPSLGIPRYNGGLFNPQNPDNVFLEQHRLSDWAVAAALDILVRDAGQPVDYAYISVRNLGAIYEGLLENKLRIKNDKLQEPVSDPQFVIRNSQFSIELVNDKGERKATGSYYTPDYIVAYIVAQTLGPLLDARAETFAAAMARVAEFRRALERTDDPGKVRLLRPQWEAAANEAREAFLGLKVLDPAMGSGHFLVNAVDFLTDGIIQRMQTFHDAHPDIPWEWNPLRELIERVRGEIQAEMARQGIQVAPERLDDTALLTRLVLKRCIYGVDLNPMAVELAKLSLWLHSFTIGAPLSFLDHHLRWGNSLIGTDVRTAAAAMRTNGNGQFSLFQGPFVGLLDLTTLMVEVVDRADVSLADVQRSAEDFAAFQQALTPYKQALDLWVSRHFGNAEADEFLRLYGNDVLPALRGEKQVSERHQDVIARAGELWAEKRFFHWDLEFPEVFVDLRKRDWAENPGFDAVVGNPPYVRSIQLRESDAATWAYYAQNYRVAAQREFDIYLCFVELGLHLMRGQGQLGMILPNKWFTTRVGEALRSLLTEQKALSGVVDFGAFQIFAEVTTYTCLLFLSKKPQDIAQVFVLDNAPATAQPLPQDPGTWRSGSIKLENLAQEAWIFALWPVGKILHKLQQFPALEKIASVFSGTGTRADAVFFMERRGSQYYSRSLEQWVTLEGEIMQPALTGQDIDPHTYNPDNYLLFPYQLIDQKAVLLSAEVMQARYPQAWAYLNQPANRALLEARDRGKYEGQPDWYSYSYPRNMHLLGSPKIVLPDVAGRAEFAYDSEGRYLIDTAYAIQLHTESQISLLALTGLLNSTVMTFFLQQTGTNLRGGYFRMKTAYLNPFPIPRIPFTTPAEERARLLAEAQTLAAAWLQSPEAPTAPYRAFLAAPLQNPKSPIQNPDVVHDLLAHLAEEMLALNRERQAEQRGFLAWLERHCGAKLDALSGKTYLQNYLGDYQKGASPLPFDDLLAVLRKNRRKLSADPAARAFQEPLEREYTASLAKLLPLKARLAAADRLIDLLVYRLYGLTEEEVEIVEGR